MHILVTKDRSGRTVYLTTNSPASHYGLPVLQITSEDVAGDFGPSDMVGHLERPDTIVTAAGVVAGWAMQPERTSTEIKAARAFLSQWPEGPQIER